MKTLLIMIFSALVASCGIPVAIIVEGQHGNYGYSSKSGVAITIDVDK